MTAETQDGTPLTPATDSTPTRAGKAEATAEALLAVRSLREGPPADTQQPNDIEPDADPDDEEEAPELEAEPDGAEGQEQEPTEDEGEPEAEDFYEVKVNGETQKVDLEALKKSYSSTGALTQEYQSLQSAKAEVSEARDNYTGLLEKAKAALDASLGPVPNRELLVNDLHEYELQKLDRQERESAMAQLDVEIAQRKTESDTEQHEAMKAYAIAEQEKVAEAIPTWEKIKSDILEYGLTQGFEEPEMQRTYDHRIWVVVNKARQWDALQSKKPASQKKLRSAKTVSRPGAARVVDPNAESDRLREIVSSKTASKAQRNKAGVELLRQSRRAQ